MCVPALSVFPDYQQTDGMFKLQLFEERLMKGLFTKMQKNTWVYLGEAEKMTLSPRTINKGLDALSVPTYISKGQERGSLLTAEPKITELVKIGNEH